MRIIKIAHPAGVYEIEIWHPVLRDGVAFSAYHYDKRGKSHLHTEYGYQDQRTASSEGIRWLQQHERGQ